MSEVGDKFVATGFERGARMIRAERLRTNAVTVLNKNQRRDKQYAKLQPFFFRVLTECDPRARVTLASRNR